MMNKENSHTIYLAGGCFWGVEAYLKNSPEYERHRSRIC